MAANSQQSVSQDKAQDRCWLQVAATSFFFVPDSAEKIREQVIKTLAEQSYLQPVLEKVKISLIRVLLVYAASIAEEALDAAEKAEIQLRFFNAQSASRSGGWSAETGSWGFFFIQNRTYPPEVHKLCLDVYLYQE